MKQNIAQYLMVVLLVVGAYMVGVYKTKVEYLEGGAPAQVAQVAGEQAQVPEEKTVLTDEEWQKVQEGAVFAKGEESAPVTIVEFTDFECPFCERYYSDTYGQIMTNYVESGRVRYIFRDYPLPFHANAELAATAARCAGKEGKYVEMHDKLFEGQPTWSTEADATETFVKYATSLGVSGGAFRTCLTDAGVLAEVQADAQLGSQVGVSGTPTFIINGKLLVGAQPFESFQSVIDAEL